MVALVLIAVAAFTPAAYAATEPGLMLDPTFASAGLLSAQVVPGVANTATSVTVLPDGDLVLGGSATLSPSSTIGVLAKFTANGAIVPAFGNNAHLTRPDLGPIAQLAVLSNGNLLALGGSLVALTPDGTPESSFGSAGTAALPATFTPERFAIAPGGAIVVLGTTTPAGGTTVPAVVRLTANGQPDQSFGAGGMAVLPVPTGEDGAPLSFIAPGGLLVQPDGDIVVIVRGIWQRYGVESYSLLERVTAAGAFDSAFGENGQTAIIGTTLGPADPLPGPDGEFLIGDMSSGGGVGASENTGLLAFSANGQSLQPPPPPFSVTLDWAPVGSLVAMPGGGDVVAFPGPEPPGSPMGPDPTPLQVSYLGSHSLPAPSAFPDEGDQDAVPLPAGASDPLGLLAVQPDGKLLVLGTAPGPQGQPAMLLARLLGTSQASVELPSQRIDRTRRLVRLRLRCSPEQPCHGTTTLTIRPPRHAASAAGSSAFSIAAGQSELVAIKFPLRARKLLNRRSPTLATVTMFTSNGPTRTARIHIPGLPRPRTHA
ncbi:MAG TPA: hypothetical protein VHX88_10715 [Solirubrobacteraceae bacterium]|jgi:uncharacterized delta-60 repeat protein|nr:hypothetical protein [Solirubrobacteraceae bacterium]